MSLPTVQDFVDAYEWLGVPPRNDRFGIAKVDGDVILAHRDGCCALTALVAEGVAGGAVERLTGRSPFRQVAERYPALQITHFVLGFDGTGTGHTAEQTDSYRLGIAVAAAVFKTGKP